MDLEELLLAEGAFATVVQPVAANPTKISPERQVPNARCALNGRCLLFY